ncbi:hypothetical protein EV356DRAFT_528526 [Viridothelium virens]|uniref:DASH complex subunit DAD2 n=1 Tax=Viridothelium virens TaxID=1048519 RepID=A0A6A6HMN0_VIRVR|nr:hypothetical protein EV356DRAFT_528526 [Viridothelium virens]
MAFTGRTLPPHLRHPSISGSQAASGQSPVLLARINEKKVELENLRQLRDLSAGLATQMETLEEKLATLTDGTEAVAAVLSNWHNVLRAIHMASQKIPKPKDNTEEQERTEKDVPLPQTLVRVPTNQAAAVTQRAAEGADD